MLMQEDYTENLPFVYALCCPADWERVSPLLEILQKNDCRLCWDQPSAAGNAEVILAFLSRQSVEDHSFRSRFNRSILGGKPVAAVLLDPVELSPVMKAQLELEQVAAVDYAVCHTDGACCLALLQLPAMKPCLEQGKTIDIPKPSLKKYYL